MKYQLSKIKWPFWHQSPSSPSEFLGEYRIPFCLGEDDEFQVVLGRRTINDHFKNCEQALSIVLSDPIFNKIISDKLMEEAVRLAFNRKEVAQIYIFPEDFNYMDYRNIAASEL